MKSLLVGLNRQFINNLQRQSMLTHQQPENPTNNPPENSAPSGSSTLFLVGWVGTASQLKPQPCPMPTPAYRPPGTSKAKSPAELAANFEWQLIETARRSIAMRRYFPEVLCRWRRAATTGPNSELALVFTWRPGEPPETEIWPYAKIERLAAQVSDEEAYAELARYLRANEAANSENQS